MFKKKHTNISSEIKDRCFKTIIDDRTKIFVFGYKEEMKDKSTFEERFLKYLASYEKENRQNEKEEKY